MKSNWKRTLVANSHVKHECLYSPKNKSSSPFQDEVMKKAVDAFPFYSYGEANFVSSVYSYYKQTSYISGKQTLALIKLLQKYAKPIAARAKLEENRKHGSTTRVSNTQDSKPS